MDLDKEIKNLRKRLENVDFYSLPENERLSTLNELNDSINSLFGIYVLNFLRSIQEDYGVRFFDPDFDIEVKEDRDIVKMFLSENDNVYYIEYDKDVFYNDDIDLVNFHTRNALEVMIENIRFSELLDLSYSEDVEISKDTLDLINRIKSL